MFDHTRAFYYSEIPCLARFEPSFLDDHFEADELDLTTKENYEIEFNL